jgi:hypothetical protein
MKDLLRVEDLTVEFGVHEGVLLTVDMLRMVGFPDPQEGVHSGPIRSNCPAVCASAR